ncbi:hypothetical protein VTL71DRAFT_12102 [Oculimacula yallundae]|uniref:Uncharacterized protein n=1 Tax=Oculimacula yallundae TaxID=86028 RepID=A0ABR4CS00_9HELO
MRCLIAIVLGFVALTHARPRAERTPSSLRLQPKPLVETSNTPSLPLPKAQSNSLPNIHSTPPKAIFKIRIQPLLPSKPISKTISRFKRPKQITLLPLEPIYLSPNGSTTSSPTLAAFCHLSHSTRIYCGNFVTPISAAVGAPAALFSSIRGSKEEGEGTESGLVTLGFEVLEGRIVWRGMARQARWVVKMGEGGNGSVWACFGQVEESGSGNGNGGGEDVAVELMVD